MKRTLALLGALFLCGVLSGCSGDPQADAINGVVARMRDAATDVNNITKEVDKAVKKHETEKTPLDFTDAIKMAKKLEDTGKKLQELKVKQIEKVKLADEDEKAELARQFKNQINTAFVDLNKSKKDLNAALQKAEALDAGKVEDLRTKIREAEGPFETLARQG